MALGVAAQGTISEDLPQLLQASVKGNPSLRAAWIEMQASGIDLEVAERARWPSVSVVLEAQSGNKSAAPAKVLRVEQTLWDGGVVSQKVREMEAQKRIALHRYGLQQQQVFLQVVAAWQSMMVAMEKIDVADRALGRLGQYKEQMERRVKAEASPRIDLEQVNARYDQTLVERTQYQTALKNAMAKLEQLTGLSAKAANIPKRLDLNKVLQGTAWSEEIDYLDFRDIVSQHPAVLRAKAEEEVAQARYEGKAAERLPQLYFRADQPMGRSPGNPDTSMSQFVGIRYTPGAGFATHLQAAALATRTRSAQENTQTAERETLELFENDRDELLSAYDRSQTLTRAVKGSEQVMESYRRQFQAGRKSWLDLLNSAREVAQNEYAQAEARMSMMAAYWKYRVRAQLPIEEKK